MIATSSRSRVQCFRALAALGSLLLCLLVLEVGFRVKAWHDDREVEAFGRLGSEPLVEDPTVEVRTKNIIRLSRDPRIIYELIPGVHATYKGAVIHINEHGFRGEPLRAERSPEEIRIVGLGDSVMFGWGVEADASYLNLLARRLRRDRPDRNWTVINSAVPGYNTAMEVATLKRKLLPLGPDLVLVHYVDNDRSLPNFIRNPAPYLALDQSFLWRWIYYSLKEGIARMPDDRLARPDRDPDAVPAVYADMVGTEGYARAMRELAELRDAHGFEVLLVSTMGLPDEVEEIATSLGFTAIDGRAAAVRHLESLGLGIGDYARSELVLAPDDPHPSVLGHRILADVIAEHLERSGLLERLEQRAGG
jgi:lysophospholipase L1-like esterase